MTALAELGIETRAAIKAADRHGKTATTAVDHGAAIWLAHGRDGGRLTPERTDDRCQWRLVDGKTITGHVGTVSANDGKTGAALALALSLDESPPTTAAAVHAALANLGITTSDTRPMGKGLTYVAMNKKRDTAKHVRTYVENYVATRDAALEDGKRPGTARKAAIATANKAAGMPTPEGNGGGSDETGDNVVSVNQSTVWRMVDEVMPTTAPDMITALETAVAIDAITVDRLARLGAAITLAVEAMTTT